MFLFNNLAHAFAFLFLNFKFTLFLGEWGNVFAMLTLHFLVVFHQHLIFYKEVLDFVFFQFFSVFKLDFQRVVGIDFVRQLILERFDLFLKISFRILNFQFLIIEQKVQFFYFRLKAGNLNNPWILLIIQFLTRDFVFHIFFQ